MSTEPDLSVVVPVHNAGATIGPLVDQLREIPSTGVEIILVDDCSSDDSADLLTTLAGRHDDVRALFHETNHGAGIARNTGFAEATGRYTLFFDADDEPHIDALGAVIAPLDESGADLAIMPYRYRRGGVARHETMNAGDVQIWHAYVGSAPQRVVRLNDSPRLLGFSNYPWNKLLRTAVYRDAGLRFGSTPVHNDILGHWHSVLFARNVLLFNQEACTHVVETGGKNLTNQHSRVRLSLFEAYDEAYDFLEAHSHLRNRYSHHYWASFLRTADWARARIAPELIDEFNDRLQQHLLRMDMADFARIRMRRDPALADAIVRRALA